MGKNGGGLQKELCNALLDKLEWDGQGKGLDIGTGSGRVAIYLAKKYPLVRVVGIDYWGNPWAYSRAICDKNAEIEGVADRVSFQRASAVNLPFEDGEYDLVISNFVFHSVRVLNKTSLIKEALRVVRKGGAFAFQDLFNQQFYGDIGLFYKELQTWGLKELRLVHTSVKKRYINNKLSETDLDRKFENPTYPHIPTVRPRLIGVINDNMQHVGQATYVRGMLKGQGWYGR
ncbi:class I SAM-dependent methyltransferase [Chloroflexota bacterium]